MCDLWKHTTEERTPVGAIPAQIEFALGQLLASDAEGGGPLRSNATRNESKVPITRTTTRTSTRTIGPAHGEGGLVPKTPARTKAAVARRSPRQIKLYNSGSFFDRAAVPFEDYPAIAERVSGFERVIVESHPSLIGDATLRFRDRLAQPVVAGADARRLTNPHEGDQRLLTSSPTATTLEVAMGLETAHPAVLEKLHKRFDLDDFAKAAESLRRDGIALRVFVLVRPPFLDEAEGIEWAVRSTRFAFDCGATVVSLIPTRFGNGALEALAAQGRFAPPRPESLEQALEEGIGLGRGRVFADLWDFGKFSSCPRCVAARRERLQELNLGQRRLPPVNCECRGTAI
jgi:uncharacterized Fe-S cluster-containing MiaB family protein